MPHDYSWPGVTKTTGWDVSVAPSLLKQPLLNYFSSKNMDIVTNKRLLAPNVLLDVEEFLNLEVVAIT